MRYAARTDANHAEIKRAIEALGFKVQDMKSVGGGFPDLCVGVPKIGNVLLEIKTKTGKPNKLQEKWHSEWTGHSFIVHSVEEALDAIGVNDD